MHAEYRYCIVPFADLSDAMCAIVQEASALTLRHSIAGVDRVLLKRKGCGEDCVGCPCDGYGINTYTEILVVLAGEDWQSADI